MGRELLPEITFSPDRLICWPGTKHPLLASSELPSYHLKAQGPHLFPQLRVMYKPQSFGCLLSLLSFLYLFLELPFICVIKIGFFPPVILSYVSFILRPATEFRRVEENMFLPLQGRCLTLFVYSEEFGDMGKAGQGPFPTFSV